MITLEEIIKQNSLLPPIIDTNNSKGMMMLGQAQSRFNSNLPTANRMNNFNLNS